MNHPTLLEQVTLCKNAWGDSSLPSTIQTTWTDTVDYAGCAEYEGGLYRITFSNQFIEALMIMAPLSFSLLWDEVAKHELAHVAQHVAWPNMGMRHNAQFRKLMRLVGYNPKIPSLVCTTREADGNRYVSGTGILTGDIVDIAKLLLKESKRG
jgi:hypothetical protein